MCSVFVYRPMCVCVCVVCVRAWVRACVSVGGVGGVGGGGGVCSCASTVCSSL